MGRRPISAIVPPAPSENTYRPSLSTPRSTICAEDVNRASPRQYQAMGYIARGSWFFGFDVGADEYGFPGDVQAWVAVGCTEDLRGITSLRELCVRCLYVRRRISAFCRASWCKLVRRQFQQISPRYTDGS